MQKMRWYAVVDYNTPFEQGDFLDNFPISIPDLSQKNVAEGEGIQVNGDLKIFDVIVMTQSCDLQKFQPSDPVTLCIRQELKLAQWNGQSLNNASKWVQLRKGLIEGVHLLSDYNRRGYIFGYQVVDLRRIVSVPLSYLRQFVESKKQKRVRLMPPYREHLAQAFARQFMRVGLPIDLPEKKPYI